MLSMNNVIASLTSCLPVSTKICEHFILISLEKLEVYIIFKYRRFVILSALRGAQGQKSWKQDFEITGDPKSPPNGSTFWLGFEAPGICGATPFFRHLQSRPKKSKITNKAQNKDLL